MKHAHIFTVIALGSLLTAPQFSHAQVTGYGLALYQDHDQTSEADPAPSTFFSYSASVSATATGDLTSGTAIHPGPNSYDMIPYLDQFLFDYHPWRSSLAELEAAHPAGVYQYDITGGNLAGQSGTLTLPDHLFPDQTPRLDPGVWTSLQDAPAMTDAPVSWPSYTYPGSLPKNIIQFQVVNRTTASFAYGDFGDNNVYTSDTIPAAALLSGRRYYYYLSYQVYREDFSGFANNAPGSVSLIRRTLGYFNVKANPGTLAGTINLSDSIASVGEPVTIEIKDSNGVVDTHNITLGFDRLYAVDTALTGLVSVRVKADHWLATVVTDVDTSIGQDNLDITLRNGDCDGDNVVTTDDYLIINGAFDTQIGDALFDSRADLTDDGYVTTDDYLAFNSNFDVEGDYLP